MNGEQDQWSTGGLWWTVGIISGTVERNDCVSFRILQEYDNLQNGTTDWMERNPNPKGMPNLILTLNPTLK